jgi:hypothetical protein
VNVENVVVINAAAAPPVLGMSQWALVLTGLALAGLLYVRAGRVGTRRA